MQDCAAAGLNGQGHWLAAKALSQALEPLMQIFGGMGDRARFRRPVAILPGEGVFFVAPIQTDPGLRHFGRWRRWHDWNIVSGREQKERAASSKGEWD